MLTTEIAPLLLERREPQPQVQSCGDWFSKSTVMDDGDFCTRDIPAIYVFEPKRARFLWAPPLLSPPIPREQAPTYFTQEDYTLPWPVLCRAQVGRSISDDELSGVVIRDVANTASGMFWESLGISNKPPQRTLFDKKAVAIHQLWTVARDCAKQGWDGEEARAIAPKSVLTAEAFIQALPEDILLPEFAPEPDGCISLDWIQSRDRMFALSIGTGQRLAYAWLDGLDKGHAVALFNGTVIPRRILIGIREIINHGTPAIGS